MSAEARKFYRLLERLADRDGWIDCEELMPVAKDTAQHPQQDLLCVCEDPEGRQHYAFLHLDERGRWRGSRLDHKLRATHWQFPPPFPARKEANHG